MPGVRNGNYRNGLLLLRRSHGPVSYTHLDVYKRQVEQIGKAGADLATQAPGKMPELLALLQKYGVRAITELMPEQLGAFATELRGLGAKL